MAQLSASSVTGGRDRWGSGHPARQVPEPTCGEDLAECASNGPRSEPASPRNHRFKPAYGQGPPTEATVLQFQTFVRPAEPRGEGPANERRAMSNIGDIFQSFCDHYLACSLTNSDGMRSLWLSAENDHDWAM